MTKEIIMFETDKSSASGSLLPNEMSSNIEYSEHIPKPKGKYTLKKKKSSKGITKRKPDNPVGQCNICKGWYVEKHMLRHQTRCG